MGHLRQTQRLARYLDEIAITLHSWKPNVLALLTCTARIPWRQRPCLARCPQSCSKCGDVGYSGSLVDGERQEYEMAVEDDGIWTRCAGCGVDRMSAGCVTAGCAA